MHLKFLSLIAACGVAVSAATLTTLTPTANAADTPKAKDVPILAREVLFGNPDVGNLQLSPDGKFLAYLAPIDGIMNVHVAPIDQPTKGTPVTKDTKRGIRQYFWAYNNAQILYMQDDGGDENWKLHAVDVKTLADKDLTPFENILGEDGKPIMQPNGKPLRPTAEILASSHDFPNEIVIGLNNRNPELHDVYRLNTLTGEMTKVLENEGYVGFVVDGQYRVRLAMRFTPAMQLEIFQRDLSAKDATKSWKSFATIDGVDTETTRPIGFDKAGDWLYMSDSRGRNTGGLFAINMTTGEKKVIAEDAHADVGGLMVHPTTEAIQAVAFDYLRNEWTVLDKSIQVDLDYLKTVTTGDLNIVSRTTDDRAWLVASMLDNGPVKYYRYERDPKTSKAGKATYLFSNRKSLENATLASMKPIVIKSRDGLELVSYLTIPVQSDANNDGTPDQPVPLVLNVHGGPWARDSWGFDPESQWLANRGYACLQVNFRGSTGLGKSFVNAADKEWAGKMHDDLLDAVDWAVKNKITTSDKVAIMGGSYGGYATLVGLTFTPDVFACGVDIVGPSSIATLLENIPPYWAPFYPVLVNRVGDPSTKEGRAFLDSRSPLTKVDAIKKPLLIGQGANDPRVKQSEADQIVSAMTRKNIPVTYVLFPDEGHGFAKASNRLGFYAVTEAFLAQHLGGRAEPIGDAVAKSTAKIPVGAEGIPGLKVTDTKAK